MIKVGIWPSGYKNFNRRFGLQLIKLCSDKFRSALVQNSSKSAFNALLNFKVVLKHKTQLIFYVFLCRFFYHYYMQIFILLQNICKIYLMNYETFSVNSDICLISAAIFIIRIGKYQLFITHKLVLQHYIIQQRRLQGAWRKKLFQFKKI